VLDVEGGATRTPSSPRVLLLSCLFLSNGTCVVCRPTVRSLAYCYLNMLPQPFAYKTLYSIVTKQLPSKNIHIMVFLRWKIMALCVVVWVSQADGRSPCINGDIAIQWEWSNSTPHRIKIPLPITIKLCTIDYVHETNT